MVEKKSNREIITYETPQEIVKKPTEALTFRGWLNGCVLKAKGNIDMEFMWRETLVKFNQFYPQKIVKNEIEIISGWKGQGSTEIYKGFTNDFMIKEWIKDKHTGIVKERITEVKKEDLNSIIFIIRNLPLNEPVKCYYIAKKLGYAEWKELWKERKEYFQFYYYPVKVAEALGIISYGGRGTIVRLK